MDGGSSQTKGPKHCVEVDLQAEENGLVARSRDFESFQITQTQNPEPQILSHKPCEFSSIQGMP